MIINSNRLITLLVLIAILIILTAGTIIASNSTPPTLLTPSNRTATNNNTPTLKWENSFTADHWEVWLDNDSDFSSPVPGFPENITENTYDFETEFPGSLSDDNYHWRIRGYKGDNIASFSENWSFLVDTVAPPSPENSIDNGTTISDTASTLNWESVTDRSNSQTNEVAGIEKYEIWIDNDTDFSSPELTDNSPTNSYTITSGLPNDNYTFRIRAWDSAGNVSSWSDNWTFTVNVGAGPSVNLTTPKSEYEKGEVIEITGYISGPKENLVEKNKVNLFFSSGGWVRKIKASLSDNNFNCSYRISYGDPEGIWTIRIKNENWEDTNLDSENITVTTPPDTVYYTATFWSPPNGAKFRRGENVHISISVTEAENPVENGSVTVYSPLGDNIVLREGSAGKYSATYPFSWDEPLGKWSISAEVSKKEGNSLKVGGARISVEIEPAKLKLDLLSPEELKVKAGNSIEISFRVTYPDGTPLENSITSAEVADENLNLTYQENGVYKGVFSSSSENVGGKILEIEASDIHGNKRNKKYVLMIESPPSRLQIFPIAVIAGCVVLGAIGSYVIRQKYFKIDLEDIKDEIKFIKNLQSETASKYFRKGEISRETYDSIMGDLSDRLDELKQKKAKLTSEEVTKKSEEESFEERFQELFMRELLSIPRISENIAQSLIDAGFKDIESIRKASKEELAEVEGIGTNLAERIKEKFP